MDAKGFEGKEVLYVTKVSFDFRDSKAATVEGSSLLAYVSFPCQATGF